MSTFSVTALQLVNRVHERRRMPAVGSFAETEDQATLNAINSAMEEVFSEQKWQFNKRTDGQIRLKSRFTLSASVNLAADSANVTVLQLGLLNTNLRGSFVTRVLLTDHPDYPNTPFRVIRSTDVLVSTSNLTVPFQMPSAQTGLSGYLLYNEYMLPDTVEDVIRVRYQETPLTLRHVEPELAYDEIFPRPHIEYGPPEIIAVGGFDRPTYDDDNNEAPPPQLRLAVWPVPDADYVIDYSYYYRHPELVATTDKLEGVTPNVVSRIVDLAAADMKTYFEKDEMGITIRNSLERRTERTHAAHGASRTRRKVLHGWNSSRLGGGFTREGFPGRTIGD